MMKTNAEEQPVQDTHEDRKARGRLNTSYLRQNLIPFWPVDIKGAQVKPSSGSAASPRWYNRLNVTHGRINGCTVIRKLYFFILFFIFCRHRQLVWDFGWSSVSLTLFCYTSALVQTMPTVKNKQMTEYNVLCVYCIQLHVYKDFFLVQEQKVVLTPAMLRRSKF